ncbi:MAG TPA: hypothetical protein DCL73_04320 [Treponema sp.]|nr:hypothetical protein [Treponema sp.]
MESKKYLIFAAVAVTCCFFVSCGAKKAEADSPDAPVALTVKPAGQDGDDLKLPTQTWHVSDDCICILFGYGYNDADFVRSMTAELYKKYGDAADGGLILSLVFPDNFKRGTKSIAAELPLFVNGKNVRGVILLGAPENTNYGIAHLQDSYDGFPSFPVFSFFSQDDVAGMEGTADFVLDKAQEADIDGAVKDESEQLFVKEAPDMIRRSIKYMLALDAPLPKDKNLSAHLKSIVGKVSVSRYVDPETGLQSVNHFVMN